MLVEAFNDWDHPPHNHQLLDLVVARRNMFKNRIPRGRLCDGDQPRQARRLELNKAD
jgi:hypothetical protein